METVKCFNCARCEYQNRNFWRLIKHYDSEHSADANFNVVCGVENCQKSYSNVRALCAHLRSKHNAYYTGCMIDRKCEKNVIDDDLGVSFEVPVQVSPKNNDDENYNISSINRNVDVQASAMNNVAAWSVKLREINKVSGAVCEDIRQNIGAMLSASRDSLSDSIRCKLQEFGATSAMTDSIITILECPTPLETACQSLGKEYHLNKYVEANFSFVEPVQYRMQNLDETDDDIEYMQYIPILETLKVLLQNDDIFSSVVNSHNSKDGKLRDFCDGHFHKQHQLFAVDDLALQVVLYYDDFGAVNPLGHRAKKYKIAGFYFMLANVHPKDRSRLHTIHLAALCFSKGLRKCGFEEVLRPLVNDLKTLAKEGITVVRGDGSFTLKGALCAVVADNLAAHAIGGFFESFTAVHPCRFCLIQKDKLCSEFIADPNKIRTAETYNAQLKLVERDQSFRTVYGLKTNSCLNAVPFFHVATGLPSDVMHDLLEGVVCDVVDYVINYCLLSGFITVSFLNLQIEKFPYTGCDKVNKPDSLPDPIKCRQTAAKSRCLMLLLPAMIGCKVTAGDGKWEVLLLLIELHNLALSPSLTESETYLLDDAVEAFLSRFRFEFPNESVKPKMHFLVHYGTHYRMFGPLIQYWSFRFEGKHAYFKEVACRLKCRKNVLLTLAKKHQYYHCWYLHRNDSYLHDAQTASCNGEVVLLSVLPACFKTLLLPVVEPSETVFQASVAEVNGVKYECGLAVVTGVANHDLQFSLLSGLFIVNRKLYIIGNKLENQEFLRHYQMYCGTFASSCAIFLVEDLVDPFPLSVYPSTNSTMCIVLKHYICTGI